MICEARILLPSSFSLFSNFLLISNSVSFKNKTELKKHRKIIIFSTLYYNNTQKYKIHSSFLLYVKTFLLSVLPFSTVSSSSKSSLWPKTWSIWIPSQTVLGVHPTSVLETLTWFIRTSIISFLFCGRYTYKTWFFSYKTSVIIDRVFYVCTSTVISSYISYTFTSKPT